MPMNRFIHRAQIAKQVAQFGTTGDIVWLQLSRADETVDRIVVATDLSA